jgi:hypothetical protein
MASFMTGVKLRTATMQSIMYDHFTYHSAPRVWPILEHVVKGLKTLEISFLRPDPEIDASLASRSREAFAAFLPAGQQLETLDVTLPDVIPVRFHSIPQASSLSAIVRTRDASGVVFDGKMRDTPAFPQLEKFVLRNAMCQEEELVVMIRVHR